MDRADRINTRQNLALTYVDGISRTPACHLKQHPPFMFPSSNASLTRAERLCASLSRTFDTPKVGTKDGSSTIHEFIGPLASERYALLPPKSDAAAKALLAVGLRRNITEVRLLENIRTRRGLPDLPSPRFDHFAAFLLDNDSPCFSRCAEICASYTPSKHVLDLVSHGPSRPAEGTQHGTNLPSSNHLDKVEATLDSQQFNQAHGSNIAPNATVVDVDAIHVPQSRLNPTLRNVPNANSLHNVNSEPQPITVEPEIPSPTQHVQSSETPEKLAIDLLFNDQTGTVSIELHFIPVQYVLQPNLQSFPHIAAPSAHARVGNTFLSRKGFSSVELDNSETPVAPHDQLRGIHLQSQYALDSNLDELRQEQACHVRPDAPALNLTTLQDEIQTPVATTPNPKTPATQNKTQLEASLPDSGDEVILIETPSKPTVARPFSTPPVRNHRKQFGKHSARRLLPRIKNIKRGKDNVANAGSPEMHPSNKIAPALLQNRRTAAQVSSQPAYLRRSKRRARPTARIIDDSETDNEPENQEDDEDFDPGVAPMEMEPIASQEPSSVETKKTPQDSTERQDRGLAFQKAKHVRFRDEVEGVHVSEKDSGTRALRTRSRRFAGTNPQLKASPPSQDEDEEVLDSHDNVVSHRRSATRTRSRRVPSRASRPEKEVHHSPDGAQAKNTKSSNANGSNTKQYAVMDDILRGNRRDFWKDDLMKFEEKLKADNDVDSLTTDDNSDVPLYEQGGPLQIITKRLKEGSITFEDLENINPEEETSRCYEETEEDPPYATDSASPGMKWVEDCLLQTFRSPKIPILSNINETEQRDSVDDQEEDDVYDIDKGTGSKIYKESSESSDPLESSDGEEREDVVSRIVGSKRSRREARSQASKARELQGRVCGDLLPTMTFEARRRVLRWAERDFSWFDVGCDYMEIVAARSSKRCNRCKMPEDDDLVCEESILLKLWKNMSWRKVRRMRHRHSER